MRMSLLYSTRCILYINYNSLIRTGAICLLECQRRLTMTLGVQMRNQMLPCSVTTVARLITDRCNSAPEAK
jgi:hypothetical protein